MSRKLTDYEIAKAKFIHKYATIEQEYQAKKQQKATAQATSNKAVASTVTVKKAEPVKTQQTEKYKMFRNTNAKYYKATQHDADWLRDKNNKKEVIKETKILQRNVNTRITELKKAGFEDSYWVRKYPNGFSVDYNNYKSVKQAYTKLRQIVLSPLSDPYGVYQSRNKLADRLGIPHEHMTKEYYDKLGRLMSRLRDEHKITIDYDSDQAINDVAMWIEKGDGLSVDELYDNIVNYLDVSDEVTIDEYIQMHKSEIFSSKSKSDKDNTDTTE